MRGTEAQFGGLSQDSAYLTAKSWSEAVGGIISYGMSLGLLYPGDFTAWIMLRLLQEYMFLQHLKPKERVAVVTTFFNKVRLQTVAVMASRTTTTMRTRTRTREMTKITQFLQVINKNQSRATGAAPADFEEQKRILKSTLRDAGFAVEPPTREEVKEEGGDTKQVADLKRQLQNEKNKHSGERGGGRGGGRGSRGGGRGGGARSDSSRTNRLGRPVFDRRDAVDNDGKVRHRSKKEPYYPTIARLHH